MKAIAKGNEMKILTLSEVGELKIKGELTKRFTTTTNCDWFLRLYDIPNKILVNADVIEELKDVHPEILVPYTEYVKRNKLVEFFHGKEYISDVKLEVSKNKVTQIRLSSGKTYFVKESIEQILAMIKEC